MSRFYWFFFALIVVVARVVQLCALYLCNAPTGGPFVADWNRFLWHTMFADIGFIMALAFCLQAVSLAVRGRGLRIVKIVSVVLAGVYLFACGTDDEIMRWMNQRLSFSFIGTYMGAVSDTGLVASIFKEGAFHFLFSFFTVVAAIVGLAFFSRGNRLERAVARPFNKIFVAPVVAILVFAILGCTSHMWFNPSHRRWPRIKPIPYVLVEEALHAFESLEPPADYREGILALGGNPDAEYPFWHWAGGDSANADAVEKASLDAFKARPLEERPDIILFNIESLRGWTSDMRTRSCMRFPNLCKLVLSGTYYPNAHSVGYPSIEGFLGIMVGVPSHPRATFLYNYPNTRMRSIGDVLQAAGYNRQVLCGADPKFDNELVWQQKWFDYNEFKPENDNDVALARRFVEMYRERDKNKPLFFHWMSRSMHIPFDLPADMGERPADAEAAYLRAEAYMDSALGIIVNEVKNGPRANSTLFILVGDHSYPNSAQTAESERLGKIHEGETWVSLIFAGAGAERTMDLRPVSQGSIASSIVAFLGLDVSNHFMGAKLISKAVPPNSADSLQPSDSADSSVVPLRELPGVFSFRQGDIAYRIDSLAFFAGMDDATPATVRTASWKADWDVSRPVEGFVSGRSVTVDEKLLAETTAKMRAAARAWEFVVTKNKLMP